MKWRTIMTDTEGPTGVGPVCESPEHIKLAVASDMDVESARSTVFDCCPQPHIELWSEVWAAHVAQVLTVQHAGMAGA